MDHQVATRAGADGDGRRMGTVSWPFSPVGGNCNTPSPVLGSGSRVLQPYSGSQGRYRRECVHGGLGRASTGPVGTKPKLVPLMLERAVEWRVPFGWVAGDAVYGSDRNLWLELERREQPWRNWQVSPESAGHRETL